MISDRKTAQFQAQEKRNANMKEALNFVYGVKQDFYNQRLQVLSSDLSPKQKEYFLGQSLSTQMEMF